MDLNHRVRDKGWFAGTYVFSGKVWAGTISVDDAVSLGEGDSGEETYAGTGRPAFGGASAFLDTDNCRYVVTANFGVDPCPGDPILDGNPCVEIGGGRASSWPHARAMRPTGFEPVTFGFVAGGGLIPGVPTFVELGRRRVEDRSFTNFTGLR